MDEIIGLVMVLYILGSVAVAVLKKAGQLPPSGEFGDADSVHPSRPPDEREAPPPVVPPRPDRLPQPVPMPQPSRAPQPLPGRPRPVAAGEGVPLPGSRPVPAWMPEASGEGIGVEGPAPEERVARPQGPSRARAARSRAAAASASLPGLQDAEALRRAVLLAEILGPPRAVRPHAFYPRRGTDQPSAAGS